MLLKSTQKNISTYTTLFDNVIKPILLYSSEVWGKNINIAEDIQKIGNSLLERFHNRICKDILGVHKRASNLASLAELGRFPIYIEIHNRMIRFLLRFRGMKKDKLVYKAFQEQLHKGQNNSSWVKKTKEILDKNGLSFIFEKVINEEKEILGPEIKRISNGVSSREKYIFFQKWESFLEEKRSNQEGKLIFYAKLKGDFQQEKYLHLNNIKHRNAIRDIRMSTHKLMIETGRYDKVPKEQRFCSVCTNREIETEEHFLLKCVIYKDERDILINREFGVASKELDIRYIKNLFKENNLYKLNEFGKFIHECTEKRIIAKLLQSITQKIGIGSKDQPD